MESNKLAVLDNKIPVKSIPEEKLNEILLTSFLSWLANLLSLTDEVSAKRLETALPAVKEHCWSMGFDEIKKMFQMYADNKLGIDPIPNYFDRILFGKIAKAYKEQRPMKKKPIELPEISEAKKILLTNKGVLRTYDDYKNSGDVGAGVVWVYDHLDEIGAINFSKEDKWQAMKTGRRLEKAELDDKKAGYKNTLSDLEEKTSPRVVNRAKRIMLNDYFKTISKETLTKLLNDNSSK